MVVQQKLMKPPVNGDLVLGVPMQDCNNLQLWTVTVSRGTCGLTFDDLDCDSIKREVGTWFKELHPTLDVVEITHTCSVATATVSIIAKGA